MFVCLCFLVVPHNRCVCCLCPLLRFSQVCREFQRGNCARGETDCRFAHPSDSPMIDTSDNTVTVCMDYIKSRCSREKCKYFHPPAHLQAKVKAAQHQANQTAVAAQAAATAAAMVRAQHYFYSYYTQCAHRGRAVVTPEATMILRSSPTKQQLVICYNQFGLTQSLTQILFTYFTYFFIVCCDFYHL